MSGTTRKAILEELRRRVWSAAPSASVTLGELQDVGKAPAGATGARQIVAIIPGVETPSEVTQPEVLRLWDIEVHVTLEVKASDADGWLKLEDLAASIVTAIERGRRRLGGLLRSEMLREEVEPAPRPVGGSAVGLMLAWKLPYVAPYEQAVTA